MANPVLAVLGSTDIIVGPLVWQPSDGSAAKDWYFMVAGLDRKNELFVTKVSVPEDERDVLRDAFRFDLVLAALAEHKGRVIHDCGDELYMARLGRSLWPDCARMTKLAAAVEEEGKSAIMTLGGS